MTAVAIEAPKPRVVLIDLSALYWRNWHATKDKPISEAFHLTLQDVRRCSNPGDLVAICCDSGKSFRKELSADYKANRPEKDQAALGELSRTKERLVRDGYLLWGASGFEADDVIATATEAAVAAGHEVLICSADKDLLQLLRPGVVCLRTHNWKEVDQQETEYRLGVRCDQLGDWLALVGDSSDNIKGCPGIGEKRATSMLQANGDWAGVVRAMEEKQFTPAITAAIQGFNFDLTRKLVELRKDVPIEFTAIYNERQVQELSTADEEINFMNNSNSQQGQPTSVPTPAENPAPQSADRTDGKEPGNERGADAVVTGQADDVSAPGELPPPISIQAELIKFEPANDAKRLSVSSVQFERQLEPYDLGEALTLARAIFKARLYPKFTSPMAVFTVIVRGREMGFPAGVSMDLFHFIEAEGKLCLTSNAIQTVAERLPDCEYLRCVHTDDKYAEWETKHRRHPEPERMRYTAEEAVQAGLCGLEPAPKTAKPGEKDKRGNWDKRRQNMLRKTARDNLIRMVYPSAGALYSAEELGSDIND